MRCSASRSAFAQLQPASGATTPTAPSSISDRIPNILSLLRCLVGVLFENMGKIFLLLGDMMFTIDNVRVPEWKGFLVSRKQRTDAQEGRVTQTAVKQTMHTILGRHESLERGLMSTTRLSSRARSVILSAASEPRSPPPNS
jgi:hypothetical protein